MTQISGLVITLNEAHNIVDCLRSMKTVCDDIVVVDSGSSDGTVELARQEGATVIVQVPFLGDGPQRVGERTGGTRRREDVAGRVIHAETPVEAFGDGAARLRVAQRRAVSVERDRIGGLVHVDHRLGEAGRARHARVAQRIVEHVVVSDFGAPCGRVFTQGSNDRFAAEHGFVCFVDHGTTSPLDSGFVFTTDHAQQGMSPIVVGFARVGNRVY